MRWSRHSDHHGISAIIRSEDLKISLMFTCSSELHSKCRLLRQQVLESVSSAIAGKDYGATIDLILVNIVIQDSDLVELKTKLSRESRDIRVDVPLSPSWIQDAQDQQSKAAILRQLVCAVDIVKLRLTRRDDDFWADELIADLRSIENGKEKVKK